MWRIGVGFLLIYTGVRLSREDKLPSLMVKREEDEELFEALTDEILDELYGVLRNGDWILSRSYTLHGDFFDLIQPRSAASHVSIYDASTDEVIEAIGTGVEARSLYAMVKESHSFVVIRPSKLGREELSAAVRRARLEVGAEFDILGMLGIYNNPEKFYCAELVAEAFELPQAKRVVRPTDLLDHGRVVYAAIRTNVALRERASERLS